LAISAIRGNLGAGGTVMTSMNISLPDEAKAFIEAQIAEEGHASADEYCLTLIREAQKRKARQALEAKLLEGLQGPVTEMTVEDWDSIEQEALERHASEQARQ
jgi:antitoxin ParD1/3/4